MRLTDDSPSQLPFVKMHGLGNDYIYLDGFTREDVERMVSSRGWGEFVGRISDRHKGVGSDGVILVCRPRDRMNHARMRMFNADGSEGVMCGNGVRCAAEFLYTHGVRRDCIRIDTPSAGQRVLHRVGDGLWQVEMGRFTAAPDAVGAVGLGGGPLLDVPLCAGGRT